MLVNRMDLFLYIYYFIIFAEPLYIANITMNDKNLFLKLYLKLYLYPGDKTKYVV